MIHEVDACLEAFIEREALAGAGVEVLFDAPTKDWASRRGSPTIDVYLYDVREDSERRHVGGYLSRDGDGVLVARTEPARYFRLSYLVTAWTQRPVDEHRLLAALLATFLRYKVLPDDYLVGSLRETNNPVLIEVAKPPPDKRQISEVWSALGGELKASLDLVVTAPMSTRPVPVTAPPPSRGAVVSMHGEPGQDSTAEHSRGPEPAAAAATGKKKK